MVLSIRGGLIAWRFMIAAKVLLFAFFKQKKKSATNSNPTFISYCKC